MPEIVLLIKRGSREGRRKLTLNRLADGKCECITKALGRYLAEAASVCLAHRGHALVSSLVVVGDFLAEFDLRRLPASDQMHRMLADLKEATEFGAAGIAILLVGELTEYQVVFRAATNTGVDYWLARKEDDDLAFSGRLEVSGTLVGGEPERKRRVRQKLKQAGRSDDRGIPAIIVVLDFGDLVAEVAKKP